MNPIYFNTFATVFLLQLGISANLYAAEHAEHDHDNPQHETQKTAEKQERIQHGPHEHGAARLTLATTDTGMEIMLETPAANVFGFEHQANDKEERKTVKTATDTLKAGNTLFIANKSAKCALDKVDIESNMVASHKEEDQKSDHKDDHDDAHKPDHKDDHHKHESHSDVDVTWVFKCETPTALTSVDTTLFSQFSQGFQHLNVEWISRSGAGTTKLDADGTIKLGK